MNEIEKMYKNAGLSNTWVEEYDDKQFWHGCYNEMIQTMMMLNDWDRKTATSVAHKECRKALPPFTAEKQLELIKWLAHKANNGLLINKRITNGGAGMVFDDLGYESTLASSSISFEECIAKLFNNLWQNLTEEEYEQVRNILKG